MINTKFKMAAITIERTLMWKWRAGDGDPGTGAPNEPLTLQPLSKVVSRGWVFVLLSTLSVRQIFQNS